MIRNIGATARPVSNGDRVLDLHQGVGSAVEGAAVEHLVPVDAFRAVLPRQCERRGKGLMGEQFTALLRRSRHRREGCPGFPLNAHCRSLVEHDRFEVIDGQGMGCHRGLETEYVHRQPRELRCYGASGKCLHHGPAQLLCRADLMAPRKRGDYGEAYRIGEAFHPVILVCKAPAVEDEPGHFEASFLEIADAPEDVVGRIERHEFTRGNDIDEVGIVAPQRNGESAADDVSEHIVEDYVVSAGTDTQGFEKVQGA
ncbi:MAG: hypothetical protein A4E57_04414 [Syntrophorhabdaceae bacterium PtaU1.Bin034]|nr:MAG: hypothetical protein A4E57_04414 [Syntrophorhabdaceae bacterium PtaU1.Bin034]